MTVGKMIELMSKTRPSRRVLNDSLRDGFDEGSLEGCAAEPIVSAATQQNAAQMLRRC